MPKPHKSFRSWLKNALVPDYNPVTLGTNGNSGWLLSIFAGATIAGIFGVLMWAMIKA